jgi:hypothetical protein
MASGRGVVEHYYRVCECAWQQPCATANPRFTPNISYTLYFLKTISTTYRHAYRRVLGSRFKAWFKVLLTNATNSGEVF